MKHRHLKVAISLAAVLLTFSIFGWYLMTHPEVWRQLMDLESWRVGVLLLLYSLVTLALAVVLHISVVMCSKKLTNKQAFSVTASSSLANFFGPLQSGPGVRAVYLKQKHNIPIKRYGLMTLYYYGFYAVFSGLFLLSGDPTWRWPLLALLVAGAAGTFYYLKLQSKRRSNPPVQLTSLAKMAAATLFQLLCIVAIYFVELTNLNPGISLGQVVSYTGAANFSLFVAFTPGAIGIREAFLVFSEQLHHINPQTVIAANVIDRSVYVLFLLLLFILLIVTHSKVKFSKKKESIDG